MPEEKTRKLGKRGTYSGEHKLKFHKTEDNAYWEITVNKKEKSEIDEQRTAFNKIKNSNREKLIDEIKTPEYKAQEAQAKEKEAELTQLREELKKSKQKKLTKEGKAERSAKEDKAYKVQTELNETNRHLNAQNTEYTRIANYAVEQKYKERKGQKKPISYNFKNQEALREARTAYQQRVKLDAKSAEERRGNDTSDRKFYDLIRNAKKNRKDSFYLYGENQIKLKEIQQITSTGKIITADKTPLKRDGEVVAYRIKSDKIISIGSTATITASNVRRPKLVVTKTKVVKKKRGNKLIFTREGNQFITTKKIELLFKKAEDKRGYNAPIYLNNKPFNPSDFIKVRGGWALTSSALSELNAPEFDGTISVRYSIIYRKELVSLETRTELGQATRAEKALYGEIKSSIKLTDGTVENVTILIRSRDAYDAIKRMAAANKKSGAAVFCVVSTDFTAKKNGTQGIIELGASLREGNALFISKDTVQDEKGRLIGKYGALDHYLVISYIDGYFVIQVKSLEMVYGGLTSDEGEIVHK
jgi:hypothetical protein